jgi:hypothetical protein
LPAGAKAAFGFKMRGGPDVDVSREFVEVQMGVNRFGLGKEYKQGNAMAIPGVKHK